MPKCKDVMLQVRHALILSLSVLFAGTILLSPATAIADPFTDIQQLADAGAVNLAVRVLDKEQAMGEGKPARWEKFERRRIALYRDRNDWKKISTRLANLPRFVSLQFRQWAGAERARALIELGQGQAARAQLRKLIWSDQKLTAVQLSDWRRLVVRSYLGDGLAADAQTAVMRFRQDYPGLDKKDYLLRARILLLNKNYSEAIDLLKAHAADPTAGALLLLTQLRGQTRTPRQVLKASYRRLRGKGINRAMQANLWAVAAEAAKRANNRTAAVLALEKVVRMRKTITLPKSIIDPEVDNLWDAYIDYAVDISNHRQLLIGLDKKWLALANHFKKKKPVAARSLYAFVMLRGQTRSARNQAGQAFMKMISTRKQGAVLLQALFEKSRYFAQPDAIPGSVRPRLVDLALARGDIDQASEIMATIRKPPKGEDQFMWWLRRARILVLGNQLKLGETALDKLLAANPKMEQLQVDRFMQVIFDLQTAGENEAAYNLFKKVMKHTDDQKTRREIYYWMADSRKAQKRYIDAAELYLKSAMYPDPKRMDPWAQTAHYQAAVVLAKAGLYQDAQTLLNHLLKVTKDPERRVALQRELQKMWAMQ